MHQFRSLFLLAAALGLFSPATVHAQVGETTEIIRGRVTDSEGRPVVGARVTITSVETNISKTSLTDSNGRYTFLFRDGGGRYQATIAFIGYATRNLNIIRQADEDVLTANAQLSVNAIAVQGIEVRAQRLLPGRGETGQQSRELSDQLLQRLPLDSFDPTSLASLTPGVVTIGADSSDIRGGFSVAGQRDALNQVTLDGGSFGSVLSGGSGGSPLSVPQEGVRRTQVVTNTFDVSRGQFSGGQVAMTTRGGNNRTSGSFSWNLRDPMLQAGNNNLTGNAYTQNRLSGGLGGPIIPNKLFYNMSGTWQRRTDDLFALQSEDPLAVERLGANPDSVTRFLGIVQDRYGFTIADQTGAYSRIGNAISLLGRVDWNMGERHTLMMRGNLNLYDQGNARIGLLELKQNGGEVNTSGGGGMVSLTSRFGSGWINDLRLSLNADNRDQLPFARLPEGRVRVSSILENGTRAVSSLVLGGERSMPVNTSETTRELMNELSFLIGDTHRLKAGLLVNQNAFTQLNTNNLFGTFAFNSLADFDARQPASFTRTLAPRTTAGGGINAALYAGDTWRPKQSLQFTYGLRFEGSKFDGQPLYNAAIDSAFGRRTDLIPSELHVSPRIGFSWRLSPDNAALKLVRGGIGEFRGRAPFSLFASAAEQTGLAAGERHLVCIGQFVPVPNWQQYTADETSIPQTCGDGSAPGPLTRSQANVTVFEPEFRAPRSWRGSLGYQTALHGTMQLSFDAMYTLGVGLYGVRDLNLSQLKTTKLGTENRTFYGDPRLAVAPLSGEATAITSRRDPRYGNVFALNSDLKSTTAQLTVALSGTLPPRLLFQTSWTVMRARDQSSFSCCTPLQGFSQPTTADDPNQSEWAASNFDRRHVMTGIIGYSVNRYADVTLINRLSSGQPFTPLVGGDVNGDGARNDRAFVFNPSAAPDTAVASAMQRLLSTAPGRVSNCLKNQTGTMADRNSCRGEWYYSLDGRVNIRPGTSETARRVNIALDLTNLLAGLDQLFHGSGDLHGWGQQSRSDPILLYPRGFDPNTNTFRYVVNEQFGQSRTQRFGFGQPFQAQLSVRLYVGAQPPGGLRAIAGSARGGGDGAGFRRGEARGAGRGEGPRFDPAQMVDRLLANNPIALVLELRDTLKMTPGQVAQITAVNDSFSASLKPRAEDAKKKLEGMNGHGEGTEAMGEIFRQLGPIMQQTREDLRHAMLQIQKILTPDQWKKLPENVKNAARPQMRGF